MSEKKKSKEQKTDGKGQEDNSSAASEETGTSPANEGESGLPDKDKVVVATNTIVESDEDETDLEVDEDVKVISVTTAEFNRTIKERVDRANKSWEKKLKESETEREGLRLEVATSIELEISNLPDEVKEIMPVADTKTAAGLKALREWLPKAKALAQKLGGEDKSDSTKDESDTDKKPVEGNTSNPPALGKKSDTEGTLQSVKSHPIYRTF